MSVEDKVQEVANDVMYWFKLDYISFTAKYRESGSINLDVHDISFADGYKEMRVVTGRLRLLLRQIFEESGVTVVTYNVNGVV